MTVQIGVFCAGQCLARERGLTSGLRCLFICESPSTRPKRSWRAEGKATAGPGTGGLTSPSRSLKRLAAAADLAPTRSSRSPWDTRLASTLISIARSALFSIATGRPPDVSESRITSRVGIATLGTAAPAGRLPPIRLRATAPGRSVARWRSPTRQEGEVPQGAGGPGKLEVVGVGSLGDHVIDHHQCLSRRACLQRRR